jgi:hypothetical protein
MVASINLYEFGQIAGQTAFDFYYITAVLFGAFMLLLVPLLPLIIPMVINFFARNLRHAKIISLFSKLMGIIFYIIAWRYGLALASVQHNNNWLVISIFYIVPAVIVLCFYLWSMLEFNPKQKNSVK